MPSIRPYGWYVLGLLVAAYALNIFDRSVFLVLLEPVRKAFGLSDSQLGLVSGLAYAVPFAVGGISAGYLSDRLRRTRLLAALIALWSGATALSGAAGGFGALLCARMAVGATEAGAPPTMLSLAADAFEPKTRSFAIGILYTGPSLGIMAGSLTGGAVAAAFGWRAALYIAALPGLVLSLAVLLTLREPLRREAERTAGAVEPGLGTLAALARTPELPRLIAALVLAALVSFAFMAWTPTLLMRVHHLPIRQAGLATAMTIGAAGAVGSLVGGWASRRQEGSRTWLWRICGLAVGLSIPLGATVLMARSSEVAILALAAWSVANGMYYGPGYALCLSYLPPARRGSGMSVILTLSNLIGSGLAPQLVGLLSDLFRSRHDATPLPHALLWIVAAGIAPTLLFLLPRRRESGASGDRVA